MLLLAAHQSTVSPTEIYVAQRGAVYPQPIIVFDESGNVLRAWGNTTIAFSNNEWGVHGMQLQQSDEGTFLIGKRTLWLMIFMLFK